MSRNYTPRAASIYSRLSSDLLVIHGHIECAILTGKFKPVFNNFARVTAAFCFASNWRCHVDDRGCIPLPSDYMKPTN